MRAYLGQALDILEANSVNRKQIDWPAFRVQVYKMARNAKTIPDTYDVIELALMKLGESHSKFKTPSEWAQQVESKPDLQPGPESRLLEGQFGYVLLRTYPMANQEQINQYATAVQDLIREVDAQSPCGWIVDLRTRTGGNSWSMLAGIGPVLGERQVGAFVDPEGNKSYWYYNNGQARLDEEVAAESTKPAYQLKVPVPPVAVMTGEQTRSAGESIAVAFRQRPNTRSFGQATGGFTTGVAGFPLPDGAMIFLTVNTYADRAGQVYEGPILPDEIVAGSNTDTALQAALGWLRAQPACVK